MNLCQLIGESLRDDIRTPLKSFVLAHWVAAAFKKIDGIGFSVVIEAILKKLSPFAAIFTLKEEVLNNNGFRDYEPLHIALSGVLRGVRDRIAINIWNLQNAVFHEQSGAKSKNLEKQFMPTLEFCNSVIPAIKNIVTQNHSVSSALTRIISPEYIYASTATPKPWQQIHKHMLRSYGLDAHAEEMAAPLRLITNVAAFYDLACLLIKNCNHRSSTEGSLERLDHHGLIWAIDGFEGRPLREAAIFSFDLMLSWMSGACIGLFIEQEDGVRHAFYIDDLDNEPMPSDIDRIEAGLLLICSAYPIKYIIVAMPSATVRIQGDPPEGDLKAIFVNLERGSPSFADLYRCGSEQDTGFALREYITTTHSPVLTEELFPRLRGLILEPLDSRRVEQAREELVAKLGYTDAWRF